ncbi:MAG: lysophospholipase [Proteobacteria bacterium]|nr:lysophospholipase [Pseudomonadota bacterium]
MVRFKNYAALDQAPVLASLFHPRRETPVRLPDKLREDLKICVGQGIEVGASFHFKHRDAPVILFFHGNGEIVSDYDELGGYFLDMGVNFFVVDYRGYGSSSGSPTFSDMMGDSHVLLDFLISYMGKKKMTGPVCVMGRSLGSAPAIELGANGVHPLKSLMIESGFALVAPLLRTLGIDPVSMGFREEEGFENLDKIKKIFIPCLIIHAQLDHLIPFAQGKALFDACPSDTKFLLEIKGANHNDIFFRGMAPYLEQVKRFSRLSQP